MKMPEYFSTYYSTPLGNLKISGTDSYITEVTFKDDKKSIFSMGILEHLPEVLFQCVSQLAEYFEGKRQLFEVPIQQTGTGFQKRVWDELVLVPYGKTISYLELSKRIGDVKAIRAAASTNGKNQVAVIVPCHRVIGSNNDLVGYSGGLSKKRWLLAHEARYAFGVQTLF